MDSTAPQLSVVCPVYQGADSLQQLVHAIDAVCRKSNIPYELILVDDGSTDDSWSEMIRLQQDFRITAIRQKDNYGQHYAIHAGLTAATGNLITVMDCDLQDDPAFLPALVEAVYEQQGSVLALRKTKRSDPYYVCSSWVLNLLLTIFTGTYNHYRTGNFGLFQKEVIQRILQLPVRDFYFPVAVRRQAGHLPVLEVEHGKRSAGQSTYTFKSQVRLACQAIRYTFRKAESGRHLPYLTETTIYSKFG